MAGRGRAVRHWGMRPAVILLLGLTLGLRHALEPDHLAAVAATLARDRGTRRAAAAGALWGLGHAATLLLVGGALLALGLAMPLWLASLAEGLVGVVLVVLGVSLLRTLLRER